MLKDFAGNLPQVTAARFGLASVAEDQALGDASQWDKARGFYQAVLDSDASQPFKNLAQERIGMLKDLQKPLAMNLLPDMTSLATTEPSVAGPMGPTTMPAPATVPAQQKFQITLQFVFRRRSRPAPSFLFNCDCWDS